MGAFGLNIEDLMKFEKDPIRKTVEDEVRKQTDVGNDKFEDGSDKQPSRFQDPDELANELGAIFDTVNPETRVDDLSETETDELRGYQRRAQRLQPIQQSNAPISRRIPGNPFSITVGPGLRNLATSLINRERTRRVQGDTKTVNRAERRAANIQSQMNEISSQLASTDDPEEKRRLQREQQKLQRSFDNAQSRAEKYEGFADRASDLTEQGQQADAAREANQERLTNRQEFIQEGLSSQQEARQKAVLNEIEQENQQEREIAVANAQSENEKEETNLLYDRKESIEKMQQVFDANNITSEERKEYASAVNNYVDLNNRRADRFQTAIKGYQNQQEKFIPGDYYYTQETAPKDSQGNLVVDPSVVAPDGVTRDTSDEQLGNKEFGDRRYYELQQQINDAEDEKEKILRQSQQIFQNSSVLGENTRLYTEPNEQQRNHLQQMQDAGFDQSAIREVAKGMGVKYDPSSSNSNNETETPQSISSVAESIGMSEQEYVQEYAKRGGYSEEEARQKIKENVLKQQ